MLTRYFPEWCAAQTSVVDASAFKAEWSFLTDGIARWFLAAIDNEVVSIGSGWPTLPDVPLREDW